MIDIGEIKIGDRVRIEYTSTELIEGEVEESSYGAGPQVKGVGLYGPNVRVIDHRPVDLGWWSARVIKIGTSYLLFDLAALCYRSEDGTGVTLADLRKRHDLGLVEVIVR